MSSIFNTSLFWMVTVCGILGAFIPVLVKMFLQVITRETDLEVNLRRQVCDLKAELGSISMVDEFAKYAKIKRKVNKVTDELTHQSDIRSTYTMRVRLFISAALYTLMGIAIFYLHWFYSKEPIAILPEDWFYPLSSLFSYPSGVPGAVSLTSWLFICSTVGKVMTNSFSQ